MKLVEAARRRRLGEQQRVNLVEAVLTDASDEDSVVLQLPLQDRSGHQLEAPSHLSGHRDLTLRRDPRLRELHAVQYQGTARGAQGSLPRQAPRDARYAARTLTQSPS